MRFVAFGVDFGNLRPADEDAVAMDELCRSWNGRLRHEMSHARVVHWYHKTGNFMVEADGLDIRAVKQLLERVSGGEKFAVFAYESFQTWIKETAAAAKSAPPATPGRRWTPGMAMDVDPGGAIPPHVQGKHPVRFGDLARPRLRLAWRHDLLLPGRSVLDPKHREGGWGAVAVQMDRQAGGKWTARALSRGAGLVRNFEKKGPRCGQE